MKRILNGNAYNGLLFLESFEDEYISANSFNFRQPIDIPSYILIPFISENVPYNLRNPNSEIETTKLNMYLFFLYRRLRISLCKIDFNSEIDSGTYPIKALRKIIELKVGESYEMSNLDTGNRNLIRCSYKDGKSETLKYMAEDDNYFILVDPDPFINDQYKIFFISNLRNLEATVYNSDPKSLCLAVKFKKDNLSITLTFEDSQRCAWAKNKIEVNRKVSKDFDLGLIGSMFDSYQYMLKMHKTHIIN